MKKHITLITATCLLLGLLSGTASAGSSKRHTIEGIVIGAGVTMLGAAIIQNLSRPEPVPEHPSRHRDRGPECWRTERVWVPAVRETRWNPGHYAPNGRWIPGRYQEFVVSEGYWETRKVKFSSNRHRNWDHPRYRR